MDETFIEDIDTIFPNLQFLVISVDFKGDLNELKKRLIGLLIGLLIDLLIDLMTRMEKLDKIKFYTNLQLSEENREVIVKSCRKWKTIHYLKY